MSALNHPVFGSLRVNISRLGNEDNVTRGPIPEDRKNAFEALRDATVNSRTIAEKLKGFLSSDNRHGDLRVIRSAALELASNAAIMLKEEEL